jgi:hypothetical protein
MRKLIGVIFLMCLSSPLFGQSRVTVLDPTVLRVSYGDSSLELNLAPHLTYANSFQVRYRPYPNCPVAPQVSLQARYEGNPNWHSMAVQQGGVFTHGGFKVNALKILFKQYSHQYVECEWSIIGQL